MAERTALEVDALKLLGLLWREPPAGARSGISTGSVTALAVGIADREGMGAVTLRRVAQDAGVTAMALYPHIGGRLELVELMLDHVAAKTHGETVLAQTQDWRARIETIALANWTSCLRHPWITEHAPGRPVPGPGAVRKYEFELAALAGIGLSDVEMDHALTALITLVNGAARAALAACYSRHRSGLDDAQWWAQLEPTLSTLAEYRQKYPTASRVSEALGNSTGKANDPEGAYRFGLALLLDGLARRQVAAAAAGRSSAAER